MAQPRELQISPSHLDEDGLAVARQQLHHEHVDVEARGDAVEEDERRPRTLARRLPRAAAVPVRDAVHLVAREAQQTQSCVAGHLCRVYGKENQRG